MHELSEAEARLRQVEEVRTRARRASAEPFFVPAVLGAVLIARGVLLSYWPHVAPISAASLVGIGAAMALSRQRMARHQAASGVLRASRIRRASALAAIAGGLIAVAVGVNILISGASASGAVAAGMGRRVAIAAAVIAIGAICDALNLYGMAPWAVLVIYGSGLVAIAGGGHYAAEHAP